MEQIENGAEAGAQLILFALAPADGVQLGEHPLAHSQRDCALPVAESVHLYKGRDHPR